MASSRSANRAIRFNWSCSTTSIIKSCEKTPIGWREICFASVFASTRKRCAKFHYDHEQIGCLLLYTSAETMLDELIRRPLDEGDILANANTIIQLGKVHDGAKIRRALHIAKHRGRRPATQLCRTRLLITACG